ncbi:hypothetical protein ACGF0D_10545 [Kitasatospora sp. NPDC048298]|uniref:hypothetical protein n=1 Tax=Kitasatospora sp. NPDC048298 TaxID=3364049 RepID=UPI00371F6379
MSTQHRHLADTANPDAILIPDTTTPDWQTITHAEQLLAVQDPDTVVAVQDLWTQNAARGREIERAAARIRDLEAERDRYRTTWTSARRRASLLRDENRTWLRTVTATEQARDRVFEHARTQDERIWALEAELATECAVTSHLAEKLKATLDASDKWTDERAELLTENLRLADALRRTQELAAIDPPTCEGCGHLESAHDPAGERDCNASAARVRGCTCEHYVACYPEPAPSGPTRPA